MKLNWVLGFALGLIGGVALAILPYAPSASAGSAPSLDAGTTIVSGGGALINVTIDEKGASTLLKDSSTGSGTSANVPFEGSEFEKLMLESWCQDMQQEQNLICDAP